MDRRVAVNVWDTLSFRIPTYLVWVRARMKFYYLFYLLFRRVVSTSI